MRLLNESDVKLFEQLCSLKQASLKKTMSSYLKGKYNKVIETKDYICAIGDIPVALVAHMDTVFPRPAIDVYYDRVKNVMWSPQGLGADDRAGVFSIIQIVRSGLRPHIVLTTDEEKGAIGATKLSYKKNPFQHLNYVIQLDRRGSQDCVFYNCDNKEFIEYVESFGFAEAIGSFSDISTLCPKWGVAGVNLSVGYDDEHSVSETLNIGWMLSTIEKVKRMLTQETIPSFEYVHGAVAYTRWFNWGKPSKPKVQGECKCKYCNSTLPANELIPVKDDSDYGWGQCCIDCLSSDTIGWCSICGEAFENKGVEKICEDCLYDEYYGYGKY